MEETCANCKFWRRHTSWINVSVDTVVTAAQWQATDAEIGDCRLLSPQPMTRESGQLSRQFPVTDQTEWCGMHLAILPANVTPIRKA